MSLTAAERVELDRLVAEQADDLDWLRRVERQYPLATSVLWTADSAPCDQRRAVIAVMQAPQVGLILGGERSGKSIGLKQLSVAMALGGDHRAVRAWLEVNDLPRDVIPDGPGRVYVLALDSNASTRYHRPDFDKLIGSGKNWYNKNGKGESKLFIDCPGHDQQAEIWFKSVDQGADAMQGDSIRWWWIDEEPKTEEGRLVYGQLRARVMDQRGRGGISMVPMSGYTWVHDDLIRDKKDGAVHVELNSLHNPHLPKDRAEAHFKAMSDAEREMRQFGRFTSQSGAMYPRWTPAGDMTREGMGHVCEPFDIPDDWLRFRGADFGLVDPTVVLWGALGDDNTLYIYREYYEPNGPSFRWHAENVAEIEGWVRGDRGWERAESTEPVETGWGDPGAREGREEFSACNVGVAPANNDVKGGCDRVRERLRLQGDNRPRLKVFSTCAWTIREMGGYSIDPKRRDEAPLKKDDHTCDALRYLVMGIHEYLGLLM